MVSVFVRKIYVPHTLIRTLSAEWEVYLPEASCTAADYGSDWMLCSSQVCKFQSCQSNIFKNWVWWWLGDKCINICVRGGLMYLFPCGSFGWKESYPIHWIISFVIASVSMFFRWEKLTIYFRYVWTYVHTFIYTSLVCVTHLCLKRGWGGKEWTWSSSLSLQKLDAKYSNLWLPLSGIIMNIMWSSFVWGKGPGLWLCWTCLCWVTLYCIQVTNIYHVYL